METSKSLRKLVLTHSKVFCILLGIHYVQCHILLHIPSQDKNHLFPCLWNVILIYSIAPLPAFYFLMPGKFLFLTDLFVLPISPSIPFFQLNRAIRFTRKQRWSSLGVIIPYISNWNYRGQDKMFSVSLVFSLVGLIQFWLQDLILK